MDRLAVPRRGHVLSTVAERYGGPLREAVSILQRSFRDRPAPNKYVRLFPALPNSRSIIDRSIQDFVAWRIVSVWVTGVAVQAIARNASLIESDSWFFGAEQPSIKSLVPEEARAAVERALHSNVEPAAFHELLPYILDPHGPGSRLSVRRDPKTRGARGRKRAEGIFYTPADVADYMASACIYSLKSDYLPTVFDPACGTGVFLRAALKVLRERYNGPDVLSLACSSLFGVDIDPLALDVSAFVLLAESLPGANASPPSEGWRGIRKNLVCLDALRLDPVANTTPTSKLPQDGYLRDNRIPISSLFQTLKRGPNVVLGNPPYADLGDRSDLAELSRALETVAVKPRPNAEICLSFIEQMIRLAGEGQAAGALVLPLSIACNVGEQFVTARDLIARTRGEWRFAFFDREPHALFGEDVKTRNAIILWSRKTSEQKTILATGPLRKWRGDNRAAMFANVQFTPLDSKIRSGIPKIEGDLQAAALKILEARWARLSQVLHGIDRITLRTAMDGDDKTLFVGPTAYNFLNAFLTPPQDALNTRESLSEHPLHAVRCASRKDTLATFAILSSHLAYWWWHAFGDGFHVSRRFIADLPFGLDAFEGEAFASLSETGRQLWNAIRSRPVISLNSGRISLAYTPNGHDEIRRKVDEVLASMAGLSPTFVNEVQKFTARSVSAQLHETPDTEMEQR